jgi:hypothetical protein
MSLFAYDPHPRIATRKSGRPHLVRDQHKVGFNGTLARIITEHVGTMWCAYAFAALALSIIMVGQQVLGAVSDARAIDTYNDAEAVLHEAQQIQAHLAAQDVALEALARQLKVQLPESPVPSA